MNAENNTTRNVNNTIRSKRNGSKKEEELIYKIRYRIGLLANAIGGQRTNPPYNLEEFTQNPGVYFEKIGRMQNGRMPCSKMVEISDKNKYKLINKKNGTITIKYSAHRITM